MWPSCINVCMNKCTKRAVPKEKGTCGDEHCKMFATRFSNGSDNEKRAVDVYEELIDMNDAENAVMWYFTTIIPMTLYRKLRARRKLYSDLSSKLLEGQRVHLAFENKRLRDEDFTAESPPNKKS